MAHQNSGNCLSCAILFNRYAEFYKPLKDWFFDLQTQFPDMHISCAGRGMVDQMALFQRGATKAKWGQSAHNFNAAIDIFQLKKGQAAWDLAWFDTVVGPHLPADITWYGRLDAPYFELPHCEWTPWSQKAKEGILTLVE